MFVTDMLILMLADVIVPSDMIYFSLSTLNLSYDSLANCMERKVYTSILFELLRKAVYDHNFSVAEIKRKFRDGLLETNVRNEFGKFDNV